MRVARRSIGLLSPFAMIWLGGAAACSLAAGLDVLRFDEASSSNAGGDPANGGGHAAGGDDGGGGIGANGGFGGASGGGGQGGEAGTGGSGGEPDPGACPTHLLGPPPVLFTTLDDAAAVTAPAVGVPGTVDAAVSFTQALESGGAAFTATGSNVTFPYGGTTGLALDPIRATIDLCIRPNYADTDDAFHPIVTLALDPAGGISVRKAQTNHLQVFVSHDGSTANHYVNTGAYALDPGTWYRLTVAWDFTIQDGSQNVFMYLDGVALPVLRAANNPLFFTTPTVEHDLVIGSTSTDNADATMDQLSIYAEPLAPPPPGGVGG